MFCLAVELMQKGGQRSSENSVISHVATERKSHAGLKQIVMEQKSEDMMLLNLQQLNDKCR